MQIRLFYCPFAFHIDAKIQYVVANFVQNVMWCLQRKKSNGTVKLKVWSTAPLTFLTPFALFLFSQTDSDCICSFCRQIAYIYGMFHSFAKTYRKLHCLQTVATLHIFRQRYCCLGKRNENLICNLHKIYLGKLQKHSQFLRLLRFLQKKGRHKPVLNKPNVSMH